MPMPHSKSRSPRTVPGVVRAFLTALPLLLLGHAAAAQDGTRQTLDTVVGHGARTVVTLDVGNATAGLDFTFTGITGTQFVACRQARSGFFCLDTVGGIPTVVRWPAAASSGPGESLIACTQLPGVTRRVQCSGLTAEPAGTLWLAATKNNAHSLFKLDPDGTCAARLAGYCVTEPYSGRPSLVDIDAFDGTLVPQLGSTKGVLGLESRQNAVFFADPPPAGTRPEPRVIATAKDWGLGPKEEVLSVTFRRAGGSTYLLGVTTRDRVLQRKLGDTVPAVTVFDIAVNRANRPAGSRPAQLCTAGSGAQAYEIRASEKTGDVYLTDRNYCEVLGLDPATENQLQFVASYSTLAANGVAPAGVTATDVAPEGVSIAAGFAVDLKRCTSPEGCTAIAGTAPDKAAAKLLSVDLADTRVAGITIYRVEGIPDCRYTGVDPTASPAAALCASAGAPGTLVVGVAGEPARQHLNVAPLLPDEILQLYDRSNAPPNGLPPLLIPPQYRADAAGRDGVVGTADDYLFEALFVVPQKGLRFRDTFVLELDVPLLTGEGGAGTCFTPADRSLPSLLDWDVVVNVSEIWQSTPGAYVARAVNSDCRNPTQVEGDRLSLIPYNLRTTSTTYAPKYTTTPTGPVLNGPVGLTRDNDAVFARLVQSLYQELDDVRRDFACAARDTIDGGPLNATNQAAPLGRRTCDTLAANWANGRQKLDKCIAAAFDPKSSAGDENCQSFISQLDNFRASVPAGVSSTDFANRAGELKTRASTIRHIFLNRFLPSIPAAGFCSEKGTCTAAAP
jgi:hypothetical protein